MEYRESGRSDELQAQLAESPAMLYTSRADQAGSPESIMKFSQRLSGEHLVLE
jgi:hypothetical protein